MTKYNIEIVQSKVLNERYTSLLIHPSLNDTFFITSVHNRHLDDNLQKEELEDILEKILGYTNEYPCLLLGEMGTFLDTYFSDWLNQRGNINSVSTKNMRIIEYMETDLRRGGDMQETLKFRI